MGDVGCKTQSTSGHGNARWRDPAGDLAFELRGVGWIGFWNHGGSLFGLNHASVYNSRVTLHRRLRDCFPVWAPMMRRLLSGEQAMLPRFFQPSALNFELIDRLVMDCFLVPVIFLVSLHFRAAPTRALGNCSSNWTFHCYTCTGSTP